MADALPPTAGEGSHLAPAESSRPKVPEPAVADDSDPDFDDLDDVLDQFSAASTANKTLTPAAAPTPSLPLKATSASVSEPSSQPQPAASGPGRPIDSIPIPTGPAANESEEDFMARLTAEMSSMLSKLSGDPSTSASAKPEDMAQMGKELEEFTYRMEQEGVKPEDLLKAILGEEEGGKIGGLANQERERRESEKVTENSGMASSSTTKDGKAATGAGAVNPSFEDTIRRTMQRMEHSDSSATQATQQASSKSEEDMLAEMLRALDSGAGGADGEGDLSKLFLGMMEQLTNKDMLYEPMKELDAKYPDWLSTHKPPKIPQAEYTRFQKQAVIVKEIVAKFEERGYSDEDSTSRDYIWERMQKMQSEGAPPEELVQNPFPGMGGLPGLGGLGGGDGELEEGCPTQ